LTGHFKKTAQQHFDKGDDINATTDEENADISAKNYEKLFNRDDVSPDFSVIDQLKHRPMRRPPPLYLIMKLRKPLRE
jgi:hypothetical protein